MPGLSREAHAMQAQLTRKFTASLSAKRAGLEASWKQVQASQWSSESLAQLRHLAHRLAGSAGSYGFEGLGALALRVDIALNSVINSKEQRRLVERRTVSLINALVEMETKAEK